MALDYIIRPFTEADIATWVRFYAQLGTLEPYTETVTLAEFTKRYQQPIEQQITRQLAFRCNPDGSEGEVIGSSAIYINEDITESRCNIAVLPQYRGHGVGEALYRQQQHLLGERKPNQIVVLDNRQIQGLEFWQHRGFIVESCACNMQLAAEVAVPKPQIPADFRVRNFVPNQDEQLCHRIINDCFAEHHWFRGVKLEEVIAETKRDLFNPQGVILAYAGNQIAGYCWSQVLSEGEGEQQHEYGWVAWLGVMPAYRRRQLGRGLLLSGIEYLRQHTPTVELVVEASNSSAIALYDSLGFSTCRTMMRLVKKATN